MSSCVSPLEAYIDDMEKAGLACDMPLLGISARLLASSDNFPPMRRMSDLIKETLGLPCLNQDKADALLAVLEKNDPDEFIRFSFEKKDEEILILKNKLAEAEKTIKRLEREQEGVQGRHALAMGKLSSFEIHHKRPRFSGLNPDDVPDSQTRTSSSSSTTTDGQGGRDGSD